MNDTLKIKFLSGLKEGLLTQTDEVFETSGGFKNFDI